MTEKIHLGFGLWSVTLVCSCGNAQIETARTELPTLLEELARQYKDQIVTTKGVHTPVKLTIERGG